MTWLDSGACRRHIQAARSEGIFQPPSTAESIMQPGNAGGTNWGGIAFDPARQLALVYTMNLPFLVTLVPRAQLHAQANDPQYKDFEFARQEGTPYGMRRRAFKSGLGIPCVKPPWGQLTAVDMQHGTIRWQIPVGEAPYVRWTVGMPALGGPMATASGLTFMAATLDDRLRAFESGSGKLLWEVKLPAGGQATPMTYQLAGRQYLVIAAGGYNGDSTRGDYLIAYALPR
jgi:quinoprotein glucose dehydrogenase